MMADDRLTTTLVIPTIGRPSLAVLLHALQADPGPRPAAVIVVDDRRPAAGEALSALALPDDLQVTVVQGGGRGPAAARNRGWRLARTSWVSFLDDDVVPEPGWLAALAKDIAAASPGVAGIQGQVTVPLPDGRRPTDWERGTAGLADASWITADMTFRRRDLVRVGGFDERFPRAFREDADLALRLMAAGRRLTRGERRIQHPVRPADLWVSVRVQRGNADDALMNRLHGPTWWRRANAPRGRLPLHVVTTIAGVVAVAAAIRGGRRSALAAGGVWALCTGDFVWRRLRPGPGDAREVTTMVVTSLVIPPVATWHALRGRWQHRRAAPWRGAPDLVLFDRDGTLIHDVPYNGDPAKVDPVADAPRAVALLRERGIRVGIVTNQSAVGLGMISPDDAEAVNTEVDRQLGPFDVVVTCPHGPADGCDCRKPAPGLIHQACEALDVPFSRCVVVGDIGTDVQAAERAGAGAVLVPTAATEHQDLQSSPAVRESLLAAVSDIVHDASEPPSRPPWRARASVAQSARRLVALAGQAAGLASLALGISDVPTINESR